MTPSDNAPPAQPLHDEGYRRSLDVHHQIEALYPRIEKHGAFFRGLIRVDQRLPHPPGVTGGTRVDPLVCALAIKAATTKRAVVALCELSDGDDAIVLARVLLENACLLEWLIRGEGRRRLEAYAMFTSVMHERVIETVRRHKGRFIAAGADPQLPSDEYHRAIWNYVFRDQNGKPTRSERPTWEFDLVTGKGEPLSVKRLFREIADGQESFEYDVLYGAFGSDIVHSGPFSLSRIQHATKNRRTFTLQPTVVADLCTIALASSNTAMFLVLDSLTQYLGLDLSQELAPLKARAKEDPYALTEGSGNITGESSLEP